MSDLQNVTPIRNKRPKQQRSVELLQRIRRASEIEAPTEVPYLIKGWLAPRSLAVLHGAANVGKTFLALDIAHAVSRGVAWGGCRVQAAPVLTSRSKAVRVSTSALPPWTVRVSGFCPHP